MGQQLFCPVLMLENKELWTPSIINAEPLSCYSFTNPKTNIVYRNIFEEGVVVSWMGEYSRMQSVAYNFNDNIDILRQFSTEIEKIPDEIHGEIYRNYFMISDKENEWVKEIKNTSFLINIDTDEYVDLSKHASLPQSNVDPLPWLTAITISKDSRQINLGKWAFCRLKLSSRKPSSCKELLVNELLTNSLKVNLIL